MARIKNRKKGEPTKGKPPITGEKDTGDKEFAVHPEGETRETEFRTPDGEAEEAAAVRDTGTEGSGSELNSLELLSFRLADEEYAVDLLKVKEIIRMTEITYVPRAPEFIEGIISLRGTVIPIFDIRNRLGLKKTAPTRKSRIMIAKLQTGLMGFITDEVTDVMKVAAGEIETAPGAKEQREHLLGVFHVKERMVIYMDMDQTVGVKGDHQTIS